MTQRIFDSTKEEIFNKRRNKPMKTSNIFLLALMTINIFVLCFTLHMNKDVCALYTADLQEQIDEVYNDTHNRQPLTDDELMAMDTVETTENNIIMIVVVGMSMVLIVGCFLGAFIYAWYIGRHLPK
jgi:hypothetical protein